jgi:hypothetical protein
MPHETLELAPAAGAGIGKEIARILLARPGFIEAMADALHNALTAERRTWDSGSKQWVTEPDTRSQLQAFFGCLSHMEGEPIKRVFHQHMSDGKVDPLAVLQDSPATREALQRLLDKSKWRESGRNTKQAERGEPDVLDVG